MHFANLFWYSFFIYKFFRFYLFFICSGCRWHFSLFTMEDWQWSLVTNWQIKAQTFAQRKWFLLLWKTKHSYKNDKSTKEHKICSWRWKKKKKNTGKLFGFLCAVAEDRKAMLTLSTTSLQYLMAVHILNFKSFEQTEQVNSYQTQHLPPVLLVSPNKKWIKSTKRPFTRQPRKADPKSEHER